MGNVFICVIELHITSEGLLMRFCDFKHSVKVYHVHDSSRMLKTNLVFVKDIAKRIQFECCIPLGWG